MPLENRKASRIKIIREADITSEENWDDYISWMKENAEKFYKVFEKFIKKYRK